MCILLQFDLFPSTVCYFVQFKFSNPIFPTFPSFLPLSFLSIAALFYEYKLSSISSHFPKIFQFQFFLHHIIIMFFLLLLPFVCFQCVKINLSACRFVLLCIRCWYKISNSQFELKLLSKVEEILSTATEKFLIFYAILSFRNSAHIFNI